MRPARRTRQGGGRFSPRKRSRGRSCRPGPAATRGSRGAASTRSASVSAGCALAVGSRAGRGWPVAVSRWEAAGRCASGAASSWRPASARRARASTRRWSARGRRRMRPNGGPAERQRDDEGKENQCLDRGPPPTGARGRPPYARLEPVPGGGGKTGRDPTGGRAARPGGPTPDRGTDRPAPAGGRAGPSKRRRSIRSRERARATSGDRQLPVAEEMLQDPNDDAPEALIDEQEESRLDEHDDGP